MKKEIHPKYYPDAKAKCVCGNAFSIGATKEKIEIEICSKCHPFYTGKQTLVDTARRAEKFSARRAKASPEKTAKKKVKKSVKAENKKTKKIN